jgi:hypothetical protein
VAITDHSYENVAVPFGCRAHPISVRDMSTLSSPAQPDSPVCIVDEEWVASVLDSTSRRYAARIAGMLKDRWIDTTNDLKPLQLLEVSSPARARTHCACRIGPCHRTKEVSDCLRRSRGSSWTQSKRGLVPQVSLLFVYA